MKNKLLFIGALLFSSQAFAQQQTTAPWTGSYFSSNNYVNLRNPTTLNFNSIDFPIKEISFSTNYNDRIRILENGQTQFNSPSGYTLGVAGGVNNATIVTQGGGNISGFASLCNFTSDWNQNINSVVNRANSASFALNYNGADRFYVLGSGTVYANGQYFGSDIRLKRNIKPLEGALSKVMKLQGVTYQWNEEKRCDKCGDEVVLQSDQTTQMGFIAQEVEKVVPEVVRDMPTGVKAVAYANLVSLLVEATKEQQKTIIALEERLISLREEMDALKKGETIKASSTRGSALLQSIPNPADAEVEIGYTVSNKSDKARLEIVDLNGQPVKSMSLDNAKKKVVLEKGVLSPGIYIYKLTVNGQLVDSKKMIIK